MSTDPTELIESEVGGGDAEESSGGISGDAEIDPPTEDTGVADPDGTETTIAE